MSKIVNILRTDWTYTDAVLDDGTILTIHLYDAGEQWYCGESDTGRPQYRDAVRGTLVARVWDGGVTGSLLDYASSELDEICEMSPDEAMDAAVFSALDSLGVENPECLLCSSQRYI